jgi:hypothetical protein
MRLIVPILLLIPLAAAAEEPTQRARLEKGEIIVHLDEPQPGVAPLARVIGLIDAPPAKLWTLIDRCSLYSQYMPRIASSQELSRDGNTVRCQLVLDAPWPMSDISSITRAVHTATPTLYRRTWTLESGDYLQNDGSWTLTPFDAAGTKTFAVYEVRSRLPKEPPGFVRELATQKALPGLINALRRYAAEQR